MQSDFDYFDMDSPLPASPIQLTDEKPKDPCDNDNGPYKLFKDDYLEDLILREPQLMNQYAEDLKSFNMKKCCKEVLTEDYIQRFQYLWTDGSAYHVRKMRIKKLLRDNPCLRTMDPDLLFQRVNYFWAEYGPNAEQVDPRRGRPMKRTVRKLEGNE